MRSFFIFLPLTLLSLSSYAEKKSDSQVLSDSYAPPVGAFEAAESPRDFNPITQRDPDQCVQIAAVVNNQIITTRDLEERVLMMIKADPKDIPPSELLKIQRTVLNQLIDEKLQLEITNNAGISVSQEDIDDAIKFTEEQNKMTPGTMMRDMEKKGTSKEGVYAHFRSRIAWMRLIGYYRDTIQVGADELKELMERDQNEDKKYLLAEIVVYFDNPMEAEPANHHIEEALHRLRDGTHFSQVAYEMSHAPSAAAGGDIGWISKSQCEKAIIPVLETMKPGEISQPIRTKGGYKVVMLRNIKRPNSPSQTLTARQLEVKLPKGLSEEQRKEEEIRLNDLFSTLEGCQQFDKVEEQLEGDFHIYKDVHLPDLSKDLQEVLQKLPVGKSSKGYMNEDTIVFFMVCERRLAKAQSVSKEETSDHLVNKRLTAFAEQKLRDLRRVASIDVRI